MKRFLHLSRYAGVGFGALLLVSIVYRFGVENALACFRVIGIWSLPVLGFSAAWKCLNTIAWILALPTGTERPSFWRLYRVNLAGDVINGLLPTANLGGELAKPCFLRREMSVSACSTGLMANKTMELLAGQALVLAGVATALWMWEVPWEVRLGLSALALAGLTLVGVGLIAQRREPLTRLCRFLTRIGVRLESPMVQDAVGRIDAELATFLSFKTRRLWACLGIRFLSLGVGVCETYVLLRLLGFEHALLPAFFLFSLGMIIDAAFFFVPGSLGTMEAGTAFLFVLMGMDPAVGLSLALYKRMRRIFWMSMGGILLYVPGRLHLTEPAPA